MNTESKPEVAKLEFVVLKLDYAHEKKSMTPQDCANVIRIAQQFKKGCELTSEQIYNVAAQKRMTIYLALKSDDRAIIGFAHLLELVTLTGKSGRIEDVAVDEAYQGQGVGRTMMQRIIHDAKVLLKLPHLDLTSRPDRERANHLYENLGFKIRDTNTRRLILTPE